MSTFANVTLTVSYDANMTTEISFFGIAPRPISLVGSDEQQAKILWPTVWPDPEPLCVQECKLCVYPVDNLLLSPNAFTAISALSFG